MHPLPGHPYQRSFSGPLRPEGAPLVPLSHLPPDLDRYLGPLAVRWARATPMHEPAAVLDSDTVPARLAPSRDRRLLLLEATFTLGQPAHPFAAGSVELALVGGSAAAAAVWLEELTTTPWDSPGPGASYRVSCSSPGQIAAHTVLGPLCAAAFDALLPALTTEVVVDHRTSMPVCPRCMLRPYQAPSFTDHEQLHHPGLDVCVDIGVFAVLDALCAHGAVPLGSCEQSGDGLAYVSFLAPQHHRMSRPASAEVWELDEDGCAMLRWLPHRTPDLAAELASRAAALP